MLINGWSCRSPQATEHLQSFIADCDRRTELAKKRLVETQDEISAEVAAKVKPDDLRWEPLSVSLAHHFHVEVSHTCFLCTDPRLVSHDPQLWYKLTFYEERGGWAPVPTSGFNRKCMQTEKKCTPFLKDTISYRTLFPELWDVNAEFQEESQSWEIVRCKSSELSHYWINLWQKQASIISSRKSTVWHTTAPKVEHVYVLSTGDVWSEQALHQTINTS